MGNLPVYYFVYSNLSLALRGCEKACFLAKAERAAPAVIFRVGLTGGRDLRGARRDLRIPDENVLTEEFIETN